MKDSEASVLGPRPLGLMNVPGLPQWGLGGGGCSLSGLAFFFPLLFLFYLIPDRPQLTFSNIELSSTPSSFFYLSPLFCSEPTSYKAIKAGGGEGLGTTKLDKIISTSCESLKGQLVFGWSHLAKTFTPVLMIYEGSKNS